MPRARPDWAALPLALPLTLGLLAIAFELPALLLPGPWRPSADWLLLASGWLLALHLRHGRWLRMATLATGVLLLLYLVDRVAMLRLLGEPPLLYDQLFLLRHLFVLTSDLWSASAAALLLALLVGVLLAIFGTRRLFAMLALPADRLPRQRLAALLAALWLIAAVGSVVHVGGEPAVRWAAPGLFANLRESHHLYRSVQRRIGSSPYAQYARIRLTRKPDVYLILVESYGRILAEHPSLRPRWLEQLKRMETNLGAAGWHAASAFSRAPVMGGRSWLAEGSLLMGMHIQYEAVFRQLVAEIERVPNLVEFLDRQGYHSVLLAPADRARPGIQNENRYHYDRCVRFEDLDYRGPQVGWGLVPDQYSLAHTEEHVLRGIGHPLFLNFHMVSSHAPWAQVPEIAPDWRALSALPGKRPNAGAGSLFTPLKRYVHTYPRFTNMGSWREDLGRRYLDSIVYDLRVLEAFLQTRQDDALVILIGDHQPPLVSAQTERFDTPIHVLARDPALLAELRKRGFRGGLQLGADEGTAVAHEALFSLLVRLLAGCCSQERALPAYRPHGIELGG